MDTIFKVLGFENVQTIAN